MKLDDIVEGNNSALFRSNHANILYEKLSNTIHSGDRKELNSLQTRIENVNFKPKFESDSLKKQKNDPLSILILEITEKCNLKCSYCIHSGEYINERAPSNKEMSFDTAKKAIDQLGSLSKGNSLIGFYGGEPLLNMGLINKTIEYTKSAFPLNNFIFSMTTNFFEGDKYVKEIVDNGFYINLSLDGPKKVHDKFRRTKSSLPTYDRIISNLHKVDAYSPGYTDTHFFILSTCHDPNDIHEIVKYFDSNNYFVTHINRSDPKGRTSKNDFPLKSFNDYLEIEYLDKILHNEDPKILRRLFDQDLNTIASRDNEPLPDTLMLNGSCYPGKKRMFVDVSGNYYPCERFGSRMKIGSVDEGVNQFLVDNAIGEFLDIRNSLCGECWAQRLCTPCMQYAKDTLGEISLNGLSQTCSSKKKGLMTALSNYVYLINSNQSISEAYFKSINPLFERRYNTDGQI